MLDIMNETFHGSIAPIEAGPIVVDSWELDRWRFPGHYVDYSVFVHGALHHDLPYTKAARAMKIATRSLIDSLGLEILPPHEEREEGEMWGPYDVRDYYIEVRGYFDNIEAINQQANTSSEDPETLAVLDYVGAWAEDVVRHDTDRIDIDDLPDAFYTWMLPGKHTEAGAVLPFGDFQNANYTLGTSNAKIAAVFDSIVGVLGDEEALEMLDQLMILGNPTSRLRVRQSLYIKTQALVDFIENFDTYDGIIRSQFNPLALRIIRYVLYEDDQ